MAFEKIFHPHTIVKHLSIKIDGFEIMTDEIVSLEIKSDFFDFGFTGTLKIKDSFDLGNSGKLLFNGKNTLIISVQDFLKDKSVRTYRITQMNAIQAGERFKVYDIQFMDEISFLLKNAYIGKSFTGTPVSAIKTYFKHLGIDDIIKNDKMSYDIVDTSTSQSFTVTASQSVYEFFTTIFRQDNIRMWQDRSTLHIKELNPAEVKPLKDPNGDDLTYTNNTMNNEYLFKIHDMAEDSNPALEMNLAKPVEKTFRFNGTKSIIDTTVNLADASKKMSMNTMDVTGLQQTIGQKFSTQANFETGNQAFDVMETYMRNNNLQIVVPGSLKYANVGTSAKVMLKGNNMYNNTQLEGDTLSSGSYFIASVNDRVIGDKLIHKIVLCRLDAQKPRVKK